MIKNIFKGPIVFLALFSNYITQTMQTPTPSDEELFKAIMDINLEHLKRLLESKVNPNVRYEHGVTPLHIATNGFKSIM